MSKRIPSKKLPKQLVIDPRQSGISGDMLLSALVDFFNNRTEINNLMNDICEIAFQNFGVQANYEVIPTTKQGIHGHQLKFSIERDFDDLSIYEFKDNWKVILKELDISKEISVKVFKALDRVILAEKFVHGKVDASLHELHFHELNSIDTVIDFTVCVKILESQNSHLLISGLPTAIGTGRVEFSHGSFSLPVPAVTYLLELTKYPIIAVDFPYELTTPSGLALLSVIAPKTVNIFPSSKIIKSRIGLGLRQEKGLPNFLRIWQVDQPVTSEGHPFQMDHIIVLETHVDDVSGENLGYLFDYLQPMKGIHDIAIYPLIMKKNRPGHCIRVLCDPNLVDPEKICLELMQVTGSLGVRFYPAQRHKTAREIKTLQVMIKDSSFPCTIKIAKYGNQIIQMKPEFEDIRKIVRETGLSSLEVQRKVIASVEKIMDISQETDEND
ncbi:MAG: nickel pincer cofactor biosynthesis protein LarC2 [Candidatus Hodarchaeales archaeon]|jgi:uncharacterized protein (TIGR00299 family) protein